MSTSYMAVLLGEWESTITGEGPCHARVRQHGRATREELDKHDEEPHDGATSSTPSIEEDLGDGKAGRRGHDGVVV